MAFGRQLGWLASRSWHRYIAPIEPIERASAL
jgi:hypothetical protein